MRIWFALWMLALPASAFGQTIIGQARVVDGDTIEMGEERIRLFAIDAPEAKQTCNRNGEEWACGEAATRKLREFVGGKPLQCRSRARDRYGRLIASCTIGRLDVARQMIDQGFATVADDASEDYREAQARIASLRIGIWDSEFIAPSEWRAANPQEMPARQARVPDREQARQTLLPRATNDSSQCLIKGNRNSRGEWIYHLPGRPYYAQTNAEEWFCTEAEARAAGYRRSRAR